MFNDRYGLTQAVIEGRKTMTRRLIPDEFFGLTWDTRGDTLVYENEYGDFIDVRHSKYTRYKVGEVVAVAQSYSTIAAGHPDVYTFLPQVAKAHKISIESVHDLAGWNNKMFTKAELMPHQIRIIGIKREWFAGMAMAGEMSGFFARNNRVNGEKSVLAAITEDAVLFADALIAELEKDEKVL